MDGVLTEIARLTPGQRAILEAWLRQRRVAVASKPISRRGLTSVPLSFAQERLWFLDQMGVGAVYNVPRLMRVSGPLDASLLDRVFTEVVRRHEVLRSTFPSVGGRPVQVVGPPQDVRAPVIDLTPLRPAQREEEVMRLAREEGTRRFDLARGPLFRVKLLRLAAEDHVILFTVHHIVSDAWSVGVLIREISALYRAFLEGGRSPLPELPVQYTDYAVWQREHLQSERLDRELAYWLSQLANAPSVLTLPTDRTRPHVQTFEGSTNRFGIPAELGPALKELSNQVGVTVFMALLAAFGVLLARYSGQADIVVGTPVAGRVRPELEGLIGCFVNMVALRLDVSGDPTFRELLGRVREVCLGAYAHQELPFEKLVEALQPERSLSHTPVFQVVFALQNAPRERFELPGLRIRLIGLDTGTSKFDLSLFMYDGEGGLVGVAEYNTHLFRPERIERMTDHFRRLLVGAVRDPDQRVWRLPLLSDEERRQVLVEWNATSQADAPLHCLHEGVQAQASRTPDAVAVAGDTTQVTYGELNRRANRLGHYLRRLGVDLEVPVGICLEPSPELVIAALAILKAGGAYVPLDPGYPRDRLRFMLEDSRIPVVITDRRHVELIAASPARSVLLDEHGEEIGGEPSEDPSSFAHPDNLAYVLYTSGSTGQPKGVACAHRGVLNLVAEFDARRRIEIGDACSLWTSPNFDVSVYEIFSPLLSGGVLHIVPAAVRLDATALFNWLSLRAIRSAYLPSFFLEPLRALLTEREHPLSLRRLLVGVEPIREPLLAELAERIPGVHIINGYGPTESTICSTLYAVPPGATLQRNTPIGRPVRNTMIYLLDAHLEPVPVGVTGEVDIGGTGVARGYLHRPDLTADRFLPDPFGLHARRVYRTGDLAYYLPDGNLVFVGRRDSQVKVRGYRIELGEIEAVLSRHPEVHEAVVVLREDAPGERRLVAYVVPRSGAQLEERLLRSYLNTRLPEYMIPAAFVVMEALPLAPNGKVDRKALPAPLPRPAPSGHITPRTALEEVLAGLWAEVLGVEAVGIAEDFFALGGHSLLGSRLVAGIRALLQVDVPLRLLFEAPTVATFADALRSDASTAERIERVAELVLAVRALPEAEVAHILTEHQDGSSEEVLS